MHAMNRRLKFAGLLALRALPALLALPALSALSALSTTTVSAGQAQQQPAPAAPAGQAAAPAQAPTPTFKMQVDYVDVDVLVTDEQGRFVRDLKKEDFQVLEDGRAQTVSDFTVVDIPVERADRPLFASQPIEPDVQSNERPFDGRVYVMLLDDLHTDALRSTLVKRAARQFIERNLGANDLMAIVHAGGRTEAAQEFTNNKRLLYASVDKFMGRKLPSATLARTSEYYRQAGMPIQDNRIPDPYEVERGFNAQSTMGVLRNIAEWFGGVRGRRKTILFVSEGIDYDITDVLRQYDAPGNAASAILDDIRQTIAITARSNVSIYGVDPRGLTSLADEAIQVTGFPGDDTPGARIGASSLRNELQMSQDSLRALSEDTGGFAVVNSNDFTTAFDRIVGDNSSYYVLAYYPSNTRRDGRFRRIEVRVTRPGVRVRARRGYVAPRGNAKPTAPRAAKNDGASPELVEALNSPLQVSGLDMKVIAAPFRGTAPNASVLLGVELAGSDLSLEANSRIEVSYMAVDASGKVREGKTNTLTMNLKPETRTRVEQTGFRMLHRMDLPPGRYQLRVAARDTAGGSVGSVLYDLEIPDYEKLPFSMSGLVLTSMSSSAMVTARPDEQLRSVLPASPTALRTFPQNDELALFAEVYDDGRLPPHAVDIVSTVKTDEGREVYKAEEERASSELQGRRGGYGYAARIPLTELAPGRYVLTVEARSRLSSQPPVSRQVQFTVAPPVVPAR
jgi:VWFA-related protein